MRILRHATALATASLLLVLVGCRSRSPADSELPRGIRWNGQTGVLSFRKGSHTSTMRFVRVPAGSFLMGGDDCARTILDEGPPRVRRIDAGFWLGATEVTRAQWSAFSGEAPASDPELPVTHISWDQVQTFVKRVSKESGTEFRLPTETEWEYACRAGFGTPWPWAGDRRELAHHAWYLANSGAHVRPVATRRPNPLGLYDMLGNVLEWTQDATEPGNRVLRGGFVLSEADGASCACRYHFPAAYGFQFGGFRLATD